MVRDMKKLHLVLLILLLVITNYQIVRADDGDTYLPLVIKDTPEQIFIIDRVDCSYIYVKWVNSSVPIDKSYYAGSFIVRKYPSLPMETGTLHHWYSDGDTEWYWGAYSFELGTLYYLDAWIKEANGSGIFWVENGDQLWYPCPPH